MATLTHADITSILKVRPNKQLIEDAQAQYSLLRMHCTGEGIENYVQDLREFMRPGMKQTLVNLIRSNRDLITRVMLGRDKIYSAKGGIEQYNLPEKQEPIFREWLSQIADGLPIKEWIRQRCQKQYDFNPNGLVFIEINEENQPYPAIKCIMDIWEYQPDGRALEYVFFKCDANQIADYQSRGMLPAKILKTQQVFRIVDDTTDRLIITGNKSTIADFTIESEVPNYFGYVPAIIISDIYGNNDYGMDSPLSSVVELLNSFMLGTGTYNLAYMRTAFPKEWMQLAECPTCDGQGELKGDPCPECNGRKIMPFLRQADVVAVDYRTEDGKNVPNPPMGIVTPPVEALQFMYDNGMSIEDFIVFTIWGVMRADKHGLDKVAGKGGNVSNTAFEAQMNEQPRNDKLKLFSQWKDSIQKFITDTCGQYLYGSAYDGSAILGGDRYMIESPDATWARYQIAVEANAPMSILDSLLIEYIENKYNNNPLLYRKFYLLMQVEPFVHEPISVIWPDMTLPLSIRLQKKYFDEWTSTLTNYDIASVPEQGGADILREMLKEYVMGEYVQHISDDNLLLTQGGNVLAMGDKVQVIMGHEKKPEHQGQTYTVTDVKDDGNIVISGGGVDAIFGYLKSDVLKTQGTKFLTAA